MFISVKNVEQQIHFEGNLFLTMFTGTISTHDISGVIRSLWFLPLNNTTIKRLSGYIFLL